MEIRNMRSSTKGIHIDLTSLSIIYDNDQTKDNLQGKIITWDKNNITNDINDSSIPNKYAHQNTSTKVSTSLVSQSMEESLQMKWKSIIHPNVNNNVSIFNEFHCYYWKLEVCYFVIIYEDTIANSLLGVLMLCFHFNFKKKIHLLTLFPLFITFIIYDLVHIGLYEYE